MTTESVERKLFETYRYSLVRILGDKALYDKEIDAVGRKEFAAWAGVFPSDRVKLKPYHYYVINVDRHNQSGSHWLACYTSGKRAYIFDSYSRSIPKLVPHLVKSIRKQGFSLGKTNVVKNQEQRGWTSEVCGVLCLSWLLTIRDLGITKAKNI